MTLYEFKFVRGDETLSSVEFRFKDDLDALDEATKHADESDIQIWHSGRQVARVKKGNVALNARDERGN